MISSTARAPRAAPASRARTMKVAAAKSGPLRAVASGAASLAVALGLALVRLRGPPLAAQGMHIALQTRMGPEWPSLAGAAAGARQIGCGSGQPQAPAAPRPP
jgi:hypothetical protein